MIHAFKMAIVKNMELQKGDKINFEIIIDEDKEIKFNDVIVMEVVPDVIPNQLKLNDEG